MKPKQFCDLAARLLKQPSAPYFEHRVREEAERICSERGLECQRDQYGNLLLRLRTAPGLRPLVLSAHIDHPGFEMIRQVARGRWLARFRGSVPKQFFKRGIPLRIMPGAVPGTLGRLQNGKLPWVEVEVGQDPVGQFDFAVWEVEDFRLRNGLVHARACDDLVGAASVLATLIELKEGRARVNVVGVLSRAEEVGFQGALALAANSAGGGLSARAFSRGRRQRAGNETGCTIAPDSLVVSLETSRELSGANMGAGVIIRVGDKASTFDSEATRFLTEVAARQQQQQPGFAYQRALMSGGTCEATAYQEFGYQCAAVCVALGNYHNCGAGMRIRAEYVNVRDACHMVDLLVESAKRMAQYDRLTGKLRQRLSRLLGQAQARLPKTV